MNRGRIIALDRPGTLKRTLHQPLLELHTDDSPKAVEAMTRAPGVISAAMFGRAIHVMVEDEHAARSALPGVLASAGRTCEKLEPVEPSLEDVFVALVQREGGAVAE